MRIKVNTTQLSQAAYELEQASEQMREQRDTLFAAVQELYSGANLPEITQVVNAHGATPAQTYDSIQRSYAGWAGRVKAIRNTYRNAQTTCFSLAMIAKSKTE